MAFTKSDARQYPLVAEAAVTYDELTSGVALSLIDLPQGSVVTGGFIVVDTVWNSATSDVLDLGDATDDDEYTATQVNLTALGATELTITGFETTSSEPAIVATWTGVGAAPSTGALRVVVEYIVSGRHNENQG